MAFRALRLVTLSAPAARAKALGRHAAPSMLTRFRGFSSTALPLSGTVSAVASSSSAPSSTLLSLLDSNDPANNVPAGVRARMGRKLYTNPQHPLGQMCGRIRGHFESGAASRDGATRFNVFDSLSPVVSTKQNFDDLLTPADHVSRKPTDTFYVTKDHLLRCHMTAHQTELLRAGHSAFLMIGDVFRRDEIDATHYPIFHQVDGVRVWTPDALAAAAGSSAESQRDFIVSDLQFALAGMVRALFGPATESKWVDAYFPFTDPSKEMEIMFEGRWLEVLGCGKIRQEIIDSCGLPAGTAGWAFGMGLERLAMVMFGVPDIRLFWSEDPRFLGQFAGGGMNVKFKPYSKMPGCYKDIAFWTPPTFHENDFFEVVREVAGDMVESVRVVDSFTHPKTGRTSRCYRILYRHMDRTLTNEEVDSIQGIVRERTAKQLGAELR